MPGVGANLSDSDSESPGLLVVTVLRLVDSESHGSHGTASRKRDSESSTTRRRLNLKPPIQLEVVLGLFKFVVSSLQLASELSSFLLALALALADVADIEATPPRLSTYEGLRAEIASKGYVLKPEQKVLTGIGRRPLATIVVPTHSPASGSPRLAV